MKTIQRMAALVLALILCLSIALPALADAHNETQAFASSVVLVTCNTADGSRKATGVAIGNLTNPADVIVVVHPWVIADQDQAQVTITTNGKDKQDNCLCVRLDESTAIVFPRSVLGGVSPLILQTTLNVPAGNAVMQLYNTGAKAVYAHDGTLVETIAVDDVVTGRAVFAADDLNRLQTDPWKSLGSAIVYQGPDGINYLLGLVQSVSPSTQSIYFRDSLELAWALVKANYDKVGTIHVASDFPEFETNVPAEPEQPSAPSAPKVDVTKVLENYNQQMSSKQLTQTIILIVAGVVIVAAIVAIVIVLLRRKNGAPVGAGKAAYKLVGLTGPLSGQEFALTSTLTLGRSSACNIVFSNNAAGVSGRHCEVSVKNGVVYLKDLGSSYGTLDNSSKKIPANEPVILRKGEAFFLGSKENGFMLR